jgi:hypothetical protein
MNKSNIRRAVCTLTSIAMFGSAFWIANAHADSSNRTLVLSVYADVAAGDTVLAGDYATAIKKIKSHGSYDNIGTVAAATNLCVAYTMVHEWETAQSKCDAAVTSARLSDADDVFDFGASRNRRLATAYSNRAVLHWLQRRSDKARADLTRARSLAPRLEFVDSNWTALNLQPPSSTPPAIASIQP